MLRCCERLPAWPVVSAAGRPGSLIALLPVALQVVSDVHRRLLVLLRRLQLPLEWEGRAGLSSASLGYAAR